MADKIEKEFVIPLRNKVDRVPRYKRTNKAIKTIKEFLVKHMKIYDRDLKKVKIDKYLNEYMWGRGIRNPPLKIKVKATKEGDIVTAELAEVPTNLKFKKEKLERREQKAKEGAEGKKKVEKHDHDHDHKEDETPEKKEEAKEKEKTSAEETMKLEKKTAKKSKHETKQ